MDTLDLMTRLHIPNDTKVILLVLDGLGGLAMTPGGQTALEQAVLKQRRPVQGFSARSRRMRSLAKLYSSQSSRNDVRASR